MKSFVEYLDLRRVNPKLSLHFKRRIYTLLPLDETSFDVIVPNCIIKKFSPDGQVISFGNETDS